MTGSEKLKEHEQWAPVAIDYLSQWLATDGELLMAMARGRHAAGHYRFADKLMFEYSQEELKAEAAEEIADAINYLALLLARDEPATCKCKSGGSCACKS